jgi:hypothetical protein
MTENTTNVLGKEILGKGKWSESSESEFILLSTRMEFDIELQVYVDSMAAAVEFSNTSSK